MEMKHELCKKHMHTDALFPGAYTKGTEFLV